MNFYEILFPDNISVGAVGGPSFATTISTTNNKNEVRSSNWSSGRNLYKINCNILSDSQIADLLSLFNICLGKAVGFRLKDYSDFIAISSIIATGDGVIKIFQLVKQYNFGGYSYTKIIYKPVINSVKLYVNNVQIQTGFSIDFSTGIITFLQPLAVGVLLTADFNFDVPVRFNADNLDIIYNGKNKSAIQNLELIEIKPL